MSAVVECLRFHLPLVTNSQRMTSLLTPTRHNWTPRPICMKEVSLFEMIGRSVAKVAAGAGVAALLIWLTYVMLDIGNMQSGFTLPQSTY